MWSGCAPDTMAPNTGTLLRMRGGIMFYASSEGEARSCKGHRAASAECGSHTPLDSSAAAGPSLMRLSGGWDSGGASVGWGPGGSGAAAEVPCRSLATTGHTHMSYYGFMFDVRAT
jgi:hypothetical protein